MTQLKCRHVGARLLAAGVGLSLVLGGGCSPPAADPAQTGRPAGVSEQLKGIAPPGQTAPTAPQPGGAPVGAPTTQGAMPTGPTSGPR